jgi:hypothetical protein
MSSSNTSDTIENYLTSMNSYETEFSANIPELIIAGLTSFGIGIYMNDDYATAGKRGLVQAVAQYIGGFVADGLQSTGYLSSNYSLLASKALFASSSFVFVSRQAGSNLPTTTLLGESVTATLAGHYLGSYYQSWMGNTSNNNTNNSNSNSNSNSASSGTPTY